MRIKDADNILALKACFVSGIERRFQIPVLFADFC
jgi:hypothetical protein